MGCHFLLQCRKVKKVKLLSHVQLFATPWTVAYQPPLSIGFSRQEYWSVVPLPSPGHLPDPGIEPRSSALQADALPSEPPGMSGGTNWESSLETYTWPRVRQAAAESGPQRSALSHLNSSEGRRGSGAEGWGFTRQRPYVHPWLVHAAVWQKPTQCHKAIILQLKTNWKRKAVWLVCSRNSSSKHYIPKTIFSFPHKRSNN